MRAALTTLFCALSWSAYAQSPMLTAYTSLETCAKAKAAAFAGLEGSISDITAAAMSACLNERDALELAYRNYYGGIGADTSTAHESARSTSSGLARSVAEMLPGIIAERRLNPPS